MAEFTCLGRTATTARVVGIGSLVACYFLPMIATGTTGVSANTKGLSLLLVTVPLYLCVSALPIIVCIAWHQSHGRVIGFAWLLICVLAPAVATLPGMATVHADLGWQRPQGIINIILTEANVLMFANLTILLRAQDTRSNAHHSARCVYWSIALASVTNMLFPCTSLA